MIHVNCHLCVTSLVIGLHLREAVQHLMKEISGKNNNINITYYIRSPYNHLKLQLVLLYNPNSPPLFSDRTVFCRENSRQNTTFNETLLDKNILTCQKLQVLSFVEKNLDKI